MKQYKVIAFDADDTLWVNETYFREAEEEFAQLLSFYETNNTIHQELYKTIIKNIPLYGYGVKSCMLSMIECANQLSNHQVSATIIDSILAIGKKMLQKPIELLEGVEETLKKIHKDYKLVVITKGDLLDQEQKLIRSGLSNYFHHIEVMSEKNEEGYLKVLKHLEVKPKEFLMIGNSLKSDILPVLAIGAKAIHIPFHTIWEYEKIDKQLLMHHDYRTIFKFNEIIECIF